MSHIQQAQSVPRMVMLRPDNFMVALTHNIVLIEYSNYSIKSPSQPQAVLHLELMAQ